MTKRWLPQRQATLAASLLLLLCALLAACAGTADSPQWKSNAESASDRFTEAWLAGDSRVAQLEFARAREETARTGRPDLVARIELLRCAVQVASLSGESCTGFDAMRDSLPPGTETAYADYLAGRFSSQQIALLPEAQRNAARAASPAAAAAVLRAIEDPLSRLVAAGVMYETGSAGYAVVDIAIETASERGWRRPLLAWLTVRMRRADAAGDADAAMRARQRIELIAPKHDDRQQAGRS